MKLQTNIPLKATEQPIHYNSRLVLLGSCFVTHIGAKLEYYKFQRLQNPFGIMFHPKAIETFLWRVVSQEKYLTEELLFHNEQWHCFDAHSECSGTDANAVVDELNRALEDTLQRLRESSHVIITLGTAWGYQLKAMGEFVANCHKVPQKEFDKVLLSVVEVQSSLESSLAYLRSINPEINIIFTVSPVRHLKDGFVENTRSKAHLISGVHEVVGTTENTTYFPSYELMMDELRDYRFYDRDMLHPSTTAIDYIWERFCEVCMTPNIRKTMEQIAQVQKKSNHRPFNPETVQHQKFLKELETEKEALIAQYPFMQF